MTRLVSGLALPNLLFDKKMAAAVLRLLGLIILQEPNEPEIEEAGAWGLFNKTLRIRNKVFFNKLGS